MFLLVLWASIVIPGPRPVTCLKCFECTEFRSTSLAPCPNESFVPLEWANDPSKYSGSDAPDEACAIGYSADTGKVYYQGGVSAAACNDPEFKSNVIRNVNSLPEGTNGQSRCCYVDGCNWNGTTALKGLSLAEFTSNLNTAGFGGDGGPMNNPTQWVPYAIIGAIVVTLIFCCCCFLCLRSAGGKKRKDDEDENLKEFGALDRAASEKGEGGSRRIQVRSVPTPDGVQVFKSRDHERYSAIDRKYNHRDSLPTSDFNSQHSTARPRSDPSDRFHKNRIGAISKDLFDNTTFKEANRRQNPYQKKKPNQDDWHHIWHNAANPDDTRPIPEGQTKTNPFRFVSSA